MLLVEGVRTQRHTKTWFSKSKIDNRPLITAGRINLLKIDAPLNVQNACPIMQLRSLETLAPAEELEVGAQTLKNRSREILP